MQLTRQERLILWDLLEIRRMLEPKDAKHWEKVTAIVECGYESLYATELDPHILEPLPELGIDFE